MSTTKNLKSPWTSPFDSYTKLKFPWDTTDNSSDDTNNNSSANTNNNSSANTTTPDYAKMAQGYMDQYLNRKPFEYDINADVLYQQYKKQAAESGRLAMEDTMARAAALTGGYGNSYAQSAGQQAYQRQLDAADQMIPELYQLAKDKYDADGQDMLNKYSVYAGLAGEGEETEWKGFSPEEASDFVTYYQAFANDPAALQMFLATQNIPDDIMYAIKYGNSNNK